MTASTMTPEAQQIAIAEACGIRGIHTVTGRGPVYSTKQGSLWAEHRVPNFPSDLNAMHEAEKVLTELQWPRYVTELSKQCANSWMPAATAAQRAEAFLRTLGKWTEA